MSIELPTPILRSALLHLLTGALGLTLLHAATPSLVSACTASQCRPGAVLPSAGAVPANAVEFVWRAPRWFNNSSDAGAPPTPHVYQVTGATRSELEITSETRAGLVHVKPKLPVTEGAELLFTFEETCRPQGEQVSTQVRIAAAAPLPTTLGALSAEIASGPVTVNVSTGECSAPVDGVYADLTVDLTEQARPFADVLRYQLKVDGAAVESFGQEYWSREARLGASGRGPAKDRVYVLCGLHRGARLMSGLSEGVHRVQLVGLLPDDTEIASSELQVELRCPAGLADGGWSDAGARADASERSDGAVVVRRDDGDDGCSLAGSTSSTSGLWTLALALGALVRRRPPAPGGSGTRRPIAGRSLLRKCRGFRRHSFCKVQRDL